MINVAAAIIENDEGQLLIARRKEEKLQAGLWEFPGGKIEKGETAEACLIRELLEEMNIVIEPYQFLGEHTHDYGTVHISLIAYLARYVSGDIQLYDHDQYAWVARQELSRFELAAADLPFVKKLIHGECEEK